jgi:hypothetical protein
MDESYCRFVLTCVADSSVFPSPIRPELCWVQPTGTGTGAGPPWTGTGPLSSGVTGAGSKDGFGFRFGAGLVTGASGSASNRIDVRFALLDLGFDDFGRTVDTARFALRLRTVVPGVSLTDKFDASDEVDASRALVVIADLASVVVEKSCGTGGPYCTGVPSGFVEAGTALVTDGNGSGAIRSPAGPPTFNATTRNPAVGSPLMVLSHRCFGPSKRHSQPGATGVHPA